MGTCECVCALPSVCVCRKKEERTCVRARPHCIGVLFMHVYDMTNPRIPQVFPIPSYRGDLASVSPLSPFTVSPLKNNKLPKKKKGEKTLLHQISPPLLTFNHTDPLIGLVNQIQMILDQTCCRQRSVWSGMWPVGEAVARPLRLFLSLPITRNQLILQVRGQQTSRKAPGVPVELIQDLTDKK